MIGAEERYLENARRWIIIPGIIGFVAVIYWTKALAHGFAYLASAAIIGTLMEAIVVRLNSINDHIEELIRKQV